MIKRYEFKDFVFELNMRYNPQLFWKMYRICHAYCLLENKTNINWVSRIYGKPPIITYKIKKN